MNEHIAQAQMIRFTTGILVEGESEEFFGHLAFCHSCRTRLEAIREISHADDPVDAVLSDALRFREDPSPMSVHPGAWAKLRIFFDRARGLGGVGLQDLGDLATDLGGYRLIPVIRTTGVGCAEQMNAPTQGELYVEMCVEGPAIGSATVIADAARGSVAVILRPPDGVTARRLHEERRPRATLVDAGGHRRYEGALLPVRGATYLLTEFEQIEDGQWTLALEFSQ